MSVTRAIGLVASRSASFALRRGSVGAPPVADRGDTPPGRGDRRHRRHGAPGRDHVHRGLDHRHRRAPAGQADPVVYSSTGQGGAVCRALRRRPGRRAELPRRPGRRQPLLGLLQAPAGTSSLHVLERRRRHLPGARRRRRRLEVRHRDGAGVRVARVVGPAGAAHLPPSPPATPATPAAPGSNNTPSQQGPAGRGSQGIADATASRRPCRPPVTRKAGAASRRDRDPPRPPTAHARRPGTSRGRTRRQRRAAEGHRRKPRWRARRVTTAARRRR